MQGAQYFHWVVANIPGLDLGAGAEVMEYIPPFQVDALLIKQTCTNHSGIYKRSTTSNALSCLPVAWTHHCHGNPAGTTAQQQKSLRRQDGTKDMDLKLENIYEQSTACLVT